MNTGPRGPLVQPFATPALQRAIMFPVEHPPGGVSITRRAAVVPSGYRESARQVPAEIEVRARSIGARGFALFGVTIFWNSIMAVFLLKGDVSPFMALHFIVGAVLIYLSLKQLRNGFVLKLGASGILATQRTASGDSREERVGLSEVTSFFCETGTIELGTVSTGGSSRPILRKVHHGCASLADGRVTKLVIEVEKPETAFYLAQLLARETGTTTS